MTSVIGFFGDRIIGTVNAVTGDRIDVLLIPEAPQSTAMNTGTPTGFPRINGYVLIPNESGATVGVISSIRVENLPYPKRRGTQQDFGLVDLPFPARLMTLIPLGTMVAYEDPNRNSNDNSIKLKVQRGVDVFPSVGDSVLLPTMHQLQAIVEGESSDVQGRILLGHSPTAGRAPVYVDPDKLFGRHLAVLGNTGGGKSCTVAGLVRWSVEAAKNARAEATQDDPEDAKHRLRPNARFIILDPNGEYAKAFEDLDDLRLFQVYSEVDDAKAQPLKVPAWLWNGEEWAAFTGAAPGVQRPILLKALRRLRSKVGNPQRSESSVAETVHIYRSILGPAHARREYLSFPQMMNVTIALESAYHDLGSLINSPEGLSREYLSELQEAAESCRLAAEAGRDGQHFRAIPAKLMDSFLSKLERLAEMLRIPDQEEVDEDTPRAFDLNDLPKYVEALAGLSPGRDMSQFVDGLNLRIHGLMSRGRMSSVLGLGEHNSTTLDKWLATIIGNDQASNGTVAVIDLSLVPSDVIHIIVAVIARMVFEALQRYRQHTGNALPTALVLEEAHTFVHRNLSDENATPAGNVCSRVFEKIAREGRKFGLGLVIASQRPSEISPTVLSQCNTFLLHRIVNDRDQDQLRRLVPDGLGGLLRELPSLPTRRAILLGWAAPSPVLVEIQEIPEAQRPHSPDPAFWDVWVGKEDRPIDWKAIADVWQGTNQGSEGTNEAIVGIGSGREGDVP